MIVIAFVVGGTLGAFLYGSENENIYTEEDLRKAIEDKVFWYKEYVKLDKRVKYWKGFHKKGIGE
jgi:hypothetical protein